MSNENGASPAAGQLRSLIERVERLTEEKKALSEDIREVFSEAKGNGFDVVVMKQVIRLRAMDPEDRAEQEAILETYLAALSGGTTGDDDDENSD